MSLGRDRCALQIGGESQRNGVYEENLRGSTRDYLEGLWVGTKRQNPKSGNDFLGKGYTITQSGLANVCVHYLSYIFIFMKKESAKSNILFIQFPTKIRV